MPDLEGPSVRLAPGVLAGNAVEPALDAAREPKVGRVDREHEPAIEDALVEPLGQDELDALAASPRIGEFLPLVARRTAAGASSRRDGSWSSRRWIEAVASPP